MFVTKLEITSIACTMEKVSIILKDIAPTSFHFNLEQLHTLLIHNKEYFFINSLYMGSTLLSQTRHLNRTFNYPNEVVSSSFGFSNHKETFLNQLLRWF